MKFIQTKDLYRIVERSSKDSEQRIDVYYKVQRLVKGWFRNKWVDVHEYSYPDGARWTKIFNTKQEAIDFVKRARIPLPKDKYTYM